MKTLFLHLGVLTQEQLDAPGSAWPWKVAARVLRNGDALTWPELWAILRWYAHNRGYDGNRRWSAADAAALKEDTEKEEKARSLLSDFKKKQGHAGTMAEVFCDQLGIDPLGKKRSSMFRFKGLNAAFPREIVEDEVRRILQAHFGKLEKVNADLERALIGRDAKDKLAWQTIPCPELKLPARYQGGLLFGQLVPRFDNRIISQCPLSGEKVPTRHCPEFLNFRWVMQLANVRIAAAGEDELHSLTADQRRLLDMQMREAGSMTKVEFKKAVRHLAQAERDNLSTMFMHPDAEEALLLDPVKKLTKSEKLKSIWPLLPEKLQRRASNIWRRGKAITLLGLRERLEKEASSIAAFDAEIDRMLDAANLKKRRKDNPITREEMLAEPILVRRLDGRAPFARPILRQAFAEVMAGKQHPAEKGGCLFRTEEILSAQLHRKIDEQTNNHLVRHRLLILERLQRDMIKDYAGGDVSRIGRITIEVNRDLREMSGKTAKEKAQDLGKRLANFKGVAKKLEEAFAGKNIRVGPGLIRKARIAEDLDWTCPYTGQKYDAFQLLERTVDKDHIIPRSDRTSDSLDSLVITFAAVNKWKGKRTALKFVEDEQGKPVPHMPHLSIVTLAQFKKFVDNLDTYKGHDDDKRRKKNRQRLLAIREYNEPEFTPGDLTQTSQLVRLGAQVLRKAYADSSLQPVVTSMPGVVTGAVRKGWNLLGCLATANPNILDQTGTPRTKTEIRDITHLHHALDASVLALASYFIPNGALWNLIAKRRLSETEQMELRTTTKGLFNFSADRRFGLTELPHDLKEQLRQRLAERRVVQHVPSEMTGLRVEQNTWRVVKEENGEALLRQRTRQPDGSRSWKEAKEKSSKILGLHPEAGIGKLQRNKGALVIPDNYGLALDPEPTIIPFHKVWTRVQELKTKLGGKSPRILRGGSLVELPKGNFRGVWKVFSVKNNASGIALDIGQPDVVRLKNRTAGHKINVLVASLLRDGMQLRRAPLTGVPVSEEAAPRVRSS